MNIYVEEYWESIDDFLRERGFKPSITRDEDGIWRISVTYPKGYKTHEKTLSISYSSEFTYDEIKRDKDYIEFLLSIARSCGYHPTQCTMKTIH